VRKLRRDLDEAKRRLSENNTAFAEVCKERDQAKMERNDEFIKHARELESERTSRRVL
jgi:F0F1-type ATP synthase membrane subunit b/b'